MAISLWDNNINATIANNLAVSKNSLSCSQLLLSSWLAKHIFRFFFLISKGAEIQALNAAGKTALELAKEHNHTSIIDYLKDNFGGVIF